jgi:predicted PurR-regulated permease PerM
MQARGVTYDPDRAAAPLWSALPFGPEPDELRVASPAAPNRTRLRAAGTSAWLLVGIAIVLTGVAWVLGETAQIVGPLVVAAVVAVVFAPLVRIVEPRIGRTGAAAVVLVSAVAAAIAIVVLVVAGIASQDAQIGAAAGDAADRLDSLLQSAGVTDAGAAQVADSLRTAAPAVVATLVHGVFVGIRGVASLAFGLSLGSLCLFFLLRDGPSIRRSCEQHMGVSSPVARIVTANVIASLRSYFKGVTLVAGFNAVVIGLAALLFGLPLWGTIAIVCFVTAYVPFAGAFAAGTFTVIVALGAKGPAVAIAMLVVVILANGLLQNVVQPFAMGAALDLSPLVVLVVTIAAGCLFGGVGLVLAAPLTSAAVHIARVLGRAPIAASISVAPPT